MKKQILHLFLLSSLLYSCASLKKQPKPPTENPNYYTQWFNEHKNEKGEIPVELCDKWYEQDQKLFKNQGERGTSVIAKVENLANQSSHGGRTRCLLVSSIDSNRIFAGSVSGGLWRSLDGGSTWAAINDQASNLSVTCIVENPFNPKEIYYGSGEIRGGSQPPGNGIYKSIDGGMTFSKLTQTSSISDMRYCNYMAHSVVDSSTLWVGTSQGVYMTQNNGTLWTKINITSNFKTGNVSGIISFPDSSMLVSFLGNRMYHSPKGVPGTFVGITDSIFPKSGGIGRILIANCKNVPKRVYSWYTSNIYDKDADRGFFKSLDGGVTWEKAFKGDTIRTGAAYQSYCQVLGVHADEPDFVMVGAVNARFSKNAGATWAVMPVGHSDNHIYTHLGNDNSFLVGNDGGLYKHSWDKIATAPKDLNKGYASSQYYAGNFAATGKTCVGGTQDNGTWRYKNGVLAKIYGGDGAYSHISLQNPNLAYVATQNGATYRMDNYLNSNNVKVITPQKEVTTEGVDFINEFQINHGDGNQLYYRTSKGLWRTTNQGVLWSRLNLKDIGGITSVAVTPSPNPTVYVGGSGIFYRIDSAASRSPKQTLTNLSNKLPNILATSSWGTMSFHPSDSTIMYVGLSAMSSSSRAWKGRYVNTDTLQWESIGGDLPSGLSVYQVQAHPYGDSVLLAATSYGLYYSTNYGKNWTKELRVPNVPIFEMKLRTDDKSLFLFTHGRGVWFLELDNLSANPTGVKNQIEPNQWSVAPNPVENTLRINSDFEISSSQIFNLEGKEILHFDSQKQLDVSMLPQGLFFLRIYDTHGRYSVKKIVK
jgi:hypothetical protein